MWSKMVNPSKFLALGITAMSIEAFVADQPLITSAPNVPLEPLQRRAVSGVCGYFNGDPSKNMLSISSSRPV
jgi:hypothetical protein